jgi:hypothetical protein
MTFQRVRRYQQVLQLVVSLLFLDISVHSFNVPTSSISVRFLRQHPSVILTPQSLNNRGDAVRNSLNVQNMITPDQVQDVLTSSIPFMDAAPHVDALSSQWLADAAAGSQSGDGWWQSYINIFKTTLSFVHSTIDGPLRAAGIEQTWGISIFLFTACTCSRCALVSFSFFSKLKMYFVRCFISSDSIVPLASFNPAVEKFRIHEGFETIHGGN